METLRTFRLMLASIVLVLGLGVSGLSAVEIVSSESRHINGFHGNTPIVQSQRMFVCFVADNLDIVIAHRVLSVSAPWSYSVVDSFNVDDPHNYCSLGIDSLGFVHVAYNHHNSSTLNYKVSSLPYDVSTMLTSSMPVTSSSISYPQFVRAGSSNGVLLFTYRSGVSGNGDQCLNRYDTVMSTWTQVACPLIDGLSTSSPYMAPPRVDTSGNLHLVWTNRVGGIFNYGIFTALYNPTANTFKDGSGLPLTPPFDHTTNQGEVVVPDSVRVSNVGLNILPNVGVTDNRLIVYLREVGDTWEVFSAHNNDGTDWTSKQLSNEHAPRLRACPTGPDTPEPRSCDMQILAPNLVQIDDRILVTYGRAIQDPRGTWSRPAAILRSMTSEDGWTWTNPKDVPGQVPAIYCELSSDTESAWTIAQDCREEVGPLYLLSPDDLYNWTHPVPDLEIYTNTGLIEAPDSVVTVNRFNLELELLPEQSTVPMGLFDKSYIVGEREIRVILWGEVLSGGFGYSPGKMQIAIGNSLGDWGLLWYPSIDIKPLEWSRVTIDWDGITVRLYKEGVLIDSIAYAGTIKDTSQKFVIGGVRSPLNQLVRPYSGKLTVRYSN